MMLCSWASGGALRKIVMTSSSWSLEDEDITTLHEDEVITNVETPGTVRPTTRRLTPEDWKPTSLTFTNSTFCPHSVFVLCGSENKQPLFPYTALTDWFL
jgi:hypothetical protein